MHVKKRYPPCYGNKQAPKVIFFLDPISFLPYNHTCPRKTIQPLALSDIPSGERPSLLGFLLLLRLFGGSAVLLDRFLGRGCGFGFDFLYGGGIGTARFVAVFPSGFSIEALDFLLSLGDILFIIFSTAQPVGG